MWSLKKSPSKESTNYTLRDLIYFEDTASTTSLEVFKKPKPSSSDGEESPKGGEQKETMELLANESGTLYLGEKDNIKIPINFEKENNTGLTFSFKFEPEKAVEEEIELWNLETIVCLFGRFIS